jgi:O-antigen ligase
MVITVYVCRLVQLHQANRMTHMDQRVRPIAWLCALLVAAPWLWPVTAGPMPAMWPNLFAWAVGALLITALPHLGRQACTAVVLGWLIAALTSAALALLQYFDLEDQLFPLVATTVPGYAYANLRQANQLATLLGAGLISLYWAVRFLNVRAPLVACMGALLIAAMTATASRTGAVHLALIGVFVVFWSRPHLKQSLGAVLLAFTFYAVMAFALPWTVQSLQGIEGRELLSRMQVEGTCSSRQVLWANVVELVRLKPLMGWGWGELAFAHYDTLFAGTRFCDLLSNAHNLPLHLAVELGIPIAVISVVGLVWVSIRARPWQESDPFRQTAWGVLALIAIHSLLEFPLWFANFQVMVMLCAWVLWSTRTALGQSEILRTPAQKLLRAPAIYTGILMLALTYVAWDYFRMSQLYTPTDERAERYRDDTFNKARGTWLFSSQVLFAQVTTTDLDLSNAEAMLAASLTTLHNSPEPRTIEKVIGSAALLNRPDLVREHMAKYEAAWPRQFDEWKRAHVSDTSALTDRVQPNPP